MIATWKGVLVAIMYGLVVAATAGWMMRLHTLFTPRLVNSLGALLEKLEATEDVPKRNITILIAIKTSEQGIHGQRLPQIHKTWLKDALETPEVDIRFFTHNTSENVWSHVKGDRPAENILKDDNELQPLMVTTACKANHLPCKTSAMFKYFLEHYPSTNDDVPTYFCNFDDDNYVMVHNLVQVLTSYQYGPREGRDIYVGRPSSEKGMNLKFGNAGNQRFHVHFLTGGAGYCLSRDLVERGRQNFTSLETTGLPDDCAVGYVVQNLGVKHIVDKRFHSHLERNLHKAFPKGEISKQVCFGYNNKHGREKGIKTFPDIPILFSEKDDPMLFRSLRCFLLQQESKIDMPDECKLEQKEETPVSTVREGNITVLIGIKTTERGVHGQRLPQIHKTWLQDVLETPEVDIRFFTHSTNGNQTSETLKGDDLIVATSCRVTDLPCKTSAMFQYFLEHYPSANSTNGVPAYFCNFDDDNYVLVPNLLHVLASYQYGPRKGRDIYVGRPHIQKGRLRFLTGGAGYCLSRDIVERGRQYFTSLRKAADGRPDDVSVGHVVHEKLGVTQIVDLHFHSHYERGLRRSLPQEEISKQVSFGYNNKHGRDKRRKFLSKEKLSKQVSSGYNTKQGRDKSIEAFPNIPILFSEEDDPMLFRSLRCFLLQEGSREELPECMKEQKP